MTKDWVHGVGHSPVCQILLQIVVRVIITSSPSAWTSSAWMLSTPADFPFFDDCTATSCFCEGWGTSLLCVSGTVQYCWISADLVSVRFRAVLCPPVRYLVLCTAFSWTVLGCISFLLFDSSLIFHQLVCHLAVVLPQMFFSLTALFFYPVFLCLFHASLEVRVHSSVLLRSFRFDSFLSHFPPFLAQIKNICSDPCFFLFFFIIFWMVISKDLTGCFSHCCVEGWSSSSAASLFMMVRGANAQLILAWEVSNTLVSFSFSVSNPNC